MNKIVKITLVLLGFSFFSACSVSDKVPLAKQANADKKEAIGEAIIDILPRTYKPFPSEVYIKKPKRVEQRALTYKERFSGVLGAHNKVRDKHKLSPLTWSNQLADISKKWANILGKDNKCQMYHHHDDVPFGENLYRSSAIVWTDGLREINPVTIKDVVKAWTDEEKWYDYKSNSCQPGRQCGHYTQAVWKGTKEVGCAMKVCADKSQTWVCSYFPAGNYVGARPY